MGDQGGDLMKKLRDMGLFLVIREIFMLLDPVSLHNSRQVCKTWNVLIQQEIWDSKKMRTKLSDRLTWRWKSIPPVTRKFEIGHDIVDIKADQELVIAALANSYVIVLERKNHRLKHLLLHEDGWNLHEWTSRKRNCIDFSKLVIISASNNSIRTWDRNTGTLLHTLRFQSYHHIEDIRMLDFTVITIRNQRYFTRWNFSPQDQELIFESNIAGHIENITMLDCSNNHIATSTDNGETKIWRKQDCKCERTFNTKKTSAIGLKFPHVITIGYEENNGLHIWNVQDGSHKRSILKTLNIKAINFSNPNFIAITIPNMVLTSYPNQIVGGEIIILEWNQIKEKRIKEDALWRRKYKWTGIGCITVALTPSSLIYSAYDQTHIPNIIAKEFWLSTRTPSEWRPSFLDRIKI